MSKRGMLDKKGKKFLWGKDISNGNSTIPQYVGSGATYISILYRKWFGALLRKCFVAEKSLEAG